MSLQYGGRAEPTTIYECDGQTRETLSGVRDRLHQICLPHTNRAVRVETVDGDVFEGHILHVDRGVLYLRQENAPHRAFFPYPNPYSNFVLPLVLFNLLTISLL
ncbi:hypothetical protein [Cohnella zeiphila]|uniref:Uncharacterized protein n=1 Tax=Cohnella zeiphila TaxID=2761120 RepID=A0A7X0SKU1_9BACL|nr:hypothetical protein [Cohnella zeiphila]MBB6731832.1 hypothetical protein [Cohnella zeiphila]